MKVLVLGNGGREHAIVWKVSKSPLADNIYCCPGNGGTAFENKCTNINISGIDNIIDFAKKEKIDLTIVGPEAPLTEGIVDKFKKEGLKIFGPSKDAARLEGSKAFAKAFMNKYGIRTAEYSVFEDRDSALKYVKNADYPLVIKTDGLAAGKGVIICSNAKEAETGLHQLMEENSSKKQCKVVIEEYLEGVEASILSVTDGVTIIPFISSKDHKRIYDGDEGPNTGGMGAIAPNPHFGPKEYEDFKSNILEPTLNGIKNEGLDYTGVIFFGVMITKKGTYLLEYNVRMGDPETQAVLPLMKSDFVEVILKAIDRKLSNFNIEWENEFSCAVVAASKGYPLKYETGKEIIGINDISEKMFAAGTSAENGVIKTSGGRVFAIAAKGKSLDKALEKAYREMEKVNFDGIYYRKDIGKINECIH